MSESFEVSEARIKFGDSSWEGFKKGKEMAFGYDELWHALEESIKLQSHYAELLNMFDNGQRMKFKDAKEWLDRLRKLDNEAEKRIKMRKNNEK